jgi:hypothetical protein
VLRPLRRGDLIHAGRPSGVAVVAAGTEVELRVAPSSRTVLAWLLNPPGSSADG